MQNQVNQSVILTNNSNIITEGSPKSNMVQRPSERPALLQNKLSSNFNIELGGSVGGQKGNSRNAETNLNQTAVEFINP